MKAIVILALLSIVLICAGCGERRVRSDGKAWLADREEFRAPPQQSDVMADIQATADEHPLAGWSR